jgi:hypothetical protein
MILVAPVFTFQENGDSTALDNQEFLKNSGFTEQSASHNAP